MNIRQIAAGSNYSLAVTSSGELYHWGADIRVAPLGPFSQVQILTPQPFEGIPGRISLVAASQLSAAVLTDENDIWFWGWHWSADATGGYDAIPPTKVNKAPLPMTRILQLVFDGIEIFALSDMGQVWSWSREMFGSAQFVGPRLVSPLENIVAIATSFAYQLALAENGILWVWPSDPTSLEQEPFKHPHLSNITRISGGSIYSTVLDADGVVWVFGEHTSLNTLARSGDPQYLIPLQVAGIEQKITNLGIGVPAGHGIVIAEDYTLWGWGRDESGQVGLGAVLPQGSEYRTTARFRFLLVLTLLH